MADKVLQLNFHNGIDADLTLGYGTDFGIIDTDGFDGSDYSIETEDYAFDGGYIKKQRMGVRSIGVHFDYKDDSAAARNGSYLSLLHTNRGVFQLRLRGAPALLITTSKAFRTSARICSTVLNLNFS